MSDWRQTLAAGLRGAADALDGGKAASAVSVADSLPADLAAGLAALVALANGLAHGNADISTLERALVAVQRVAGRFEPPELAMLIGAAEWLLPLVHRAYADGLVSGGLPPGWHPGPGTLDPIGARGR